MRTRRQSQERPPPPPPPRLSPQPPQRTVRFTSPTGPQIPPPHSPTSPVRVATTAPIEAATAPPAPAIPEPEIPQNDTLPDAAPVIQPQTLPRPTWLLRVRTPITTHSPQSRTMIISLLISPEMTASQLAGCLQQATNTNTAVVGLFDNNIFLSLDHVLAEPKPNTIYTLQWMPPPFAPLQATPWYLTVEAWLIAATIILGIALYFYQDELYSNAVNGLHLLHETTVIGPLEGIYRDGPHLLGGWEGLPLEHVCMHITSHGDRAFWINNFDECGLIYSRKLEAFLRWTRPLAYGFIGVILVLFLWLVWPTVHPPPPMADRDMAATYHAFQTILRQCQRALQAPQPRGNQQDRQQIRRR